MNAAGGLCGSCRHAREIRSDRGSRFVLCERSRTDPVFPRYPNLPVIACAGFEPRPWPPAPAPEPEPPEPPEPPLSPLTPSTDRS